MSGACRHFPSPGDDTMAERSQADWLSAWPDILAFVVGLGVARWAGWTSGDLVWSLWLSSLVVGYSTIVWMIGQPALELALASWRDRALAASIPNALPKFWALLVAGVVFFVGFFTVHFGMFHYIHSQFLIDFFPIDTGNARGSGANMATYAEVARRYWPFLPSAFLAHRHAFQRRTLSLTFNGGSIGTDHPGAGAVFSEPYRNVARMHMLIFFFAFAHFAKLESFAVYTVVYAVYFFPWRLVRRPAAPRIVGKTPTPTRAELLKSFTS
jgi:Family of unknown function (DUF6498)